MECNWASIFFLVITVCAITGNNARSNKQNYPNSNIEYQRSKKTIKDEQINLLDKGIEIGLSLKAFNEQNEKLLIQEDRLLDLERRLNLWDQTKDLCDELRVKIDTMESKLIAVETENIRLKKSIDIVFEEMSNFKTFKALEKNSRKTETMFSKSMDTNKIIHHRSKRNIGVDTEDAPSEDMIFKKIQNAIHDTMEPSREPKHTMVAFDAFRNKPFHEDQKYITFDGMKVNIGGAMDPDSGMFKAPVPGVYSFSFHGLTQDGTATYVKLVHRKMGETEWENVAGTYRRHEKEEDEQTEIQDATKILKNAEGMLALSVLLELGEGDEVALFSYHGNLRDGGWHYTHFTGYLLR